MSTKAIIHGALNGPAGSDLTYFFHGDQFVVYDWAADQVTLGLKSVTDDWVSAGPVGFAMQCDAGLSCHDVGQPAYAQKHYLFDGDYYVRYDWNAGTPRVAESTGNPSA